MRRAIRLRCEEVRTRLLTEYGAPERRLPTVSDLLYEIDLETSTTRLADLGAELEHMGFVALRTPAQRNHRFYLERTPGWWGKIDIKLNDRPARRGAADIVWLLRRQRGLVVALLGADGSGKTTTVAALEKRLPIATAAIYMGKRRTGGRTETARRTPPSSLRSLAGLVRWAATKAGQLLAVESRAWRGNVVLCDRHPLEAGLRENGEASWVRAAKRFSARRVFPRPDHLILLDAPAHVLHSRKHEHDPETLEAMNRSLAAVVDAVGGHEVCADRAQEAVVDDVEALIWAALIERRRR